MMRILVAVFALALGLTGLPSAAGPAAHDGSHDFDYEFGTWNVRVSKLTHTAHGTVKWVTYSGTHIVTPLWNGRANIGVLEIRGAAGRIEGMQLRLYNPATRTWKLSFASSVDGELQSPMTGCFTRGVGDFRAIETADGRTTVVRAVSTPISSRRYRDVIARSSDGGKTWAPVWIAIYESARPSRR